MNTTTNLVTEDITTEDEVIVLKAVIELIDSIVNHEFFPWPRHGHENIIFISDFYEKYFNIKLVDILSKIDRKVLVKKDTYLSNLETITEQPHFNGRVDEFRIETQRFRKCLNTERTIEKVWVPTIVEIGLPDRTSSPGKSSCLQT